MTCTGAPGAVPPTRVEPPGPPGWTAPNRGHALVRRAREAWRTAFCQEPMCVSRSAIQGADLRKRRTAAFL